MEEVVKKVCYETGCQRAVIWQVTEKNLKTKDVSTYWCCHTHLPVRFNEEAITTVEHLKNSSRFVMGGKTYWIVDGGSIIEGRLVESLEDTLKLSIHIEDSDQYYWIQRSWERCFNTEEDAVEEFTRVYKQAVADEFRYAALAQQRAFNYQVMVNEGPHRVRYCNEVERQTENTPEAG